MDLKLKFAGILLMVCLAVVTVSGEDDGDEECKSSIIALVEKQLASLKTCMKEMTFEHGREKAKKMMCIMKCSMIKEGFLEADGTLNVVSSMGLLNNFSPKIQTKILDYIGKNCQKFVQDIDPKEENCRSYEPLIRCCHDMFNEVCN